MQLSMFTTLHVICLLHYETTLGAKSSITEDTYQSIREQPYSILLSIGHTGLTPTGISSVGFMESWAKGIAKSYLLAW